MERALAGFAELFATDRLPSPEGVALEVLKLSRRDDVTTGELAQVIQVDPALTARLVRAANAPAFGSGRPVIAPGEAVLRLGIAAVRQLALGFALVDKYRTGACVPFDYAGFWAASLRRALLVQAIAARTRAAAADEMFACGLLVDVGTLALATVFPGEFGALLLDHGNGPERSAAERTAFGIDAGEVGRAMLGQWGFPPIFLRALAARMQPEQAGFDEGSRPLLLARGFHLADLLVEILATPPAEQAVFASAIDLVAARLGIDGSGVDAVRSELAREWGGWSRLLDLPAEPRGEGPRCTAAAAEQGVVAPLRVLFVTHRVPDRMRLVAAAAAAGNDATGVASAEEALEAAVRLRPHVLVADLTTLGASVLDLLRSLRTSDLGRDLFALVVGARGEEALLTRAIDGGADDYLHLPVDAHALLAALRRAARLLGKQRQLARELHRMQRFAGDLALNNSLLQQAVITDPLTELPNRSFANEHIERQWAAAQRHNASLACLVIDIDHFKRVNDEHGHERGDVVLRHVAAVLRATLRLQDVICRVGGEEFLVVCPDTTAADAALLAERLRQAVAATPVDGRLGAAGVTVSIGVAGRTDELRSTAELIGRADRAMYRAKALGRNQVCEHPDADT